MGLATIRISRINFVKHQNQTTYHTCYMYSLQLLVYSIHRGMSRESIYDSIPYDVWFCMMYLIISILSFIFVACDFDSYAIVCKAYCIELDKHTVITVIVISYNTQYAGYV